MSTWDADVAVVILGLKRHFGADSDEALAAKLKVAKSTIATWRRRHAIPLKTVKQLEAQHGLTFDDLINDKSDLLRDYVLRQAYYILVLDLYRASLSIGMTTAQDHEFADDLAIMEPYLKRAIVKAASVDAYQGVAGAATFLLDLRAKKVNGLAWVREARAERRRDLPR